MVSTIAEQYRLARMEVFVECGQRQREFTPSSGTKKDLEPTIIVARAQSTPIPGAGLVLATSGKTVKSLPAPILTRALEVTEISGVG